MYRWTSPLLTFGKSTATEERQKAIAYLDSYNSYLRQNPNITKLYPETYLSQERWNN